MLISVKMEWKENFTVEKWHHSNGNEVAMISGRDLSVIAYFESISICSHCIHSKEFEKRFKCGITGQF